jgi:hypothetical protein
MVVYLVVLVPCLFGADQRGHFNLGMSIVGVPVHSTTPDSTGELIVLLPLLVMHSRTRAQSPAEDPHTIREFR